MAGLALKHFTVVDYSKDSGLVKPGFLRVEKILDDRMSESDVRNSVLHHTDEWESGKHFIVRRGQEFVLDFQFNRDYDPAKDEVKIVFQFGYDPDPIKGTEVRLAPSAGYQDGEWGSNILSRSRTMMRVGLKAPADCFVGKWNLSVDTMDRNNEKIYRFAFEDPVNMLFNPWCKEDTVYMEGYKGPDEEALQEYVLSETGRIYVGSWNRISSRAWYFGQFEDVVLEAALYLLEKGSFWSPPLPYIVRGSPIFVSRKISGLVNGQDDGGVLWGNWSGVFEGGTSPMEWTGSVKILEEYMANKETVRFGQCWVFSGVVTTLCRALGIPVRSVTNFDSAHDKDATVDINLVYDEEGEFLKNKSDSVWNFHVWNEIHCMRPDLPPGYGGWQAIDATPQETSGGKFCLGPCPLQAIKDGEVNTPWDTRFVFGEVNGNVLYLRLRSDGTYKMIRTDRNHVGWFLSTKAVGSDSREDVTHLYKYQEWSSENVEAVKKATALIFRNKILKPEEGPQDVESTIIVDKDTFYGQLVKITLKLENKSQEKRKVIGEQLRAAAEMYTAAIDKQIMVLDVPETTLDPGETKDHEMTLPYENYKKFLLDGCYMKFTFHGTVKETEQFLITDKKLRLRKPHLKIEAPDKVKLKTSFNVKVSFTNPLTETLTGCKLRVEGSGFSPFVLSQGNLAPNADYTAHFDLIPKKLKKRAFVAKFDSKELLGVDEEFEVIVEK